MLSEVIASKARHFAMTALAEESSVDLQIDDSSVTSFSLNDELFYIVVQEYAPSAITSGKKYSTDLNPHCIFCVKYFYLDYIG